MSTAAFESFWAAYPKKVGKALALKKWEAMKLDDTAPTIVAHLKQRVKDDKRWKDGFVLDPATFLNQQRWQDEYEKIVYRQPEAPKSKEQVAEYFPQPCPWQAVANKILYEVVFGTRFPAEYLDTLVAMKVTMGNRLRSLYGDAPVESIPREDWRKISEQGFEWMRKAADGFSRQARKGTGGEGQGESSEIAA